MEPACDPHWHQSFSSSGLARCWRLAPGQAFGMRPRAPGVLRVTAGQAWVTLNERPRGCGPDSGDHFLQAGQTLPVSAGRHLVLESLDRSPVHFHWTPAARLAPARRQEAVVLSLLDLAHAGRLAGSALLRLLFGVAAWPGGLLAGCGRALCRLR